VICPGGLALIQEILTRELKWSEVLEVKLDKVPFPGFALGNFIHIKVARTIIPIVDIFDAPLPLIFLLINHYWRGETDQDKAVRIWDEA